MMRSRLTAVALAALCLMGAAACSNDDDPDSTAAPTTAASPATTARAGAPPGADPFCDFVRGFTERFGRVDLSLSDPQRLRTVMQDAGAAISDAQRSAPESIRADVTTMNTYFQRFLTSLQQVNFDLLRLQPNVLDQFQAAEFSAASARLDEYSRRNCGT